MEVYVDDTLVKSMHAKDHCQHLTEMLGVLRKHEMKLNPKKCAFGVSSGKFLDHIVYSGIKENLEKIQTIIEMRAQPDPRRCKV